MDVKTDFLRRLPGSEKEFSKAQSLLSIIHVDPLLLILLALLSVFGLFVLYSGSGQDSATMERQIIFYAVGYGAMFFVAQFKMAFFRRGAFWFYGAGVVLLLLIYFIGVEAKGATRWISVGFFRFQPSELVKLALPIAVAAFLSARILPPNFIHVFLSLVIILIPGLLILKQPDLGTAILVVSSGVITLFLSGLRWRVILGSFLLMLASAWPLWLWVLQPYQKKRILTLFNPDEDKLGAGWNSLQAKISIGSGGINGKGWLNGTQSQLDFLPESQTDFIIAVLAEEHGLLGVLCLLAIYTLIVLRGLFIAWTAQSCFNRLLAGTISLTFFVYVFVNIGMVSGILPVVGVPLPMVSRGGTSLVTLFVGFGILMAIATEKKSPQ